MHKKQFSVFEGDLMRNVQNNSATPAETESKTLSTERIKHLNNNVIKKLVTNKYYSIITLIHKICYALYNQIKL